MISIIFGTVVILIGGALARATGDLVLIQDAPIAIRCIVNITLAEKHLDLRWVAVVVADPSPVGMSVTIASAVDAESGLLFPIRPVGPRLAHPTTYSSATTSPVLGCTTCPAMLFTVEVAWSNGTPSIGTVR
jgi:hypothetical protein